MARKVHRLNSKITVPPVSPGSTVGGKKRVHNRVKYYDFGEIIGFNRFDTAIPSTRRI
jgi:hypothetical protein